MDDDSIMDVTLAINSVGDVAVDASGARLEVLENWASIDALQPEWNRLLQESAANSIFLTWEWIRCWANVLGDVRPVVVAVRDSRGTLVGLAPMYRATLLLGGVVPYRVLRMMGDYPTSSDYPDWIVQSDRSVEITRAIVKALKARGGWDLIWMPAMAGWTGSFERLVRTCQDEGLRIRTRTHDCAVVDLPASDPETYFRSLSKNKRQQLRAEMKRVWERPGVSVDCCAREDDLPEYLDALFSLHNRRWQEKGESGSFAGRPQQVEFYRRFAPIAQRMGWLRLYVFRDQSDIKAVQFGYVYGGVFFQVQEGFDPDYVKGVGNVLRAKVIEACVGEGVETYDFLADMSEHKRRWLARPRTGHDLLIGRGSLRNIVVDRAGIWPSGRFMRQISPSVLDTTEQRTAAGAGTEG
jgi:CelD/BcsL family acetyltransferase involved in cellulose biosynthesis